MLAHVIVSGRVQGVGFRYSAMNRAIQLGLTGWVQNKIDGSVEMDVEGSEELVEEFLTDVKAGLNQVMKVENMTINKSEAEKGYMKFTIK
ncbi:acylphosphatase [Virgibacillus siamensis]|uniref:acylphosphatase n=1 Tax=Virgibacillus siamensis TaxID=480071 RepID=UPI0009875EC2|nr:acylphosphatase [Virgibacillus siamensis]